MEIGKNLEAKVAVAGAGLALALGATACGENEPIIIPESAIELGTISTDGNVGFLLRGDDRVETEQVICGGVERAVKVKQNGDVVVTCFNAVGKDVVVR